MTTAEQRYRTAFDRMYALHVELAKASIYDALPVRVRLAVAKEEFIAAEAAFRRERPDLFTMLPDEGRD